MSELLLIRHGATALAGTFCGHSDPPLDARGRQQVHALLRELATDSIEVVYASDLRRAHETGAMLATAHGAPLCTLPGLREIHFGAWEGLTWEAIEQRDPDNAEQWLREYPRYAAPGGETLDSFESRVLQTIKKLLREETRPMAVVSHAGVMRVILQRLLGYSADACLSLTKDYCSVVRSTPPHAVLARAAFEQVER
jgi:alpha-ribazole phosphatase